MENLAHLPLHIPPSWLQGSSLGLSLLLCLLAAAALKISLPALFQKGSAVPRTSQALIDFLRECVGLKASAPVVESWMANLLKYGALHRSHFVFLPSYSLWEPKAVRAILGTEFEGVGSGYPSAMGALMKAEASPGIARESHKLFRKDFGALLSADKMDQYVDQIVAIADSFVASWVSRCNIKCLDDCKQFTLAVICRVIIGLDITEENIASFRDLTKTWVAGFFSMGINLPGTKYNKALKAMDAILKQLRQQLQQYKDQGGAAGTSILQQAAQLKQSGGIAAYDQDALESITLAFVFAGHDTSATLIQRTLQALLVNPAVMEKALEEQAALSKQHGETITAAMVSGMAYLDAVIKEVLRLYPVGIISPRKVLKDTAVQNYVIPKGSMVCLGIQPYMSLLPKDDPYVQGAYSEVAGQDMDPERWLNSSRTPQAYMPWGAGVKSCIGKHLAVLETKIMVATMLRRCEWRCDLGRVSYFQSFLRIEDFDQGVPMQVFAKGG